MGPTNPNPQALPNPGDPSARQFVAASFSQVEFTAGPIPPPELLRGYEQICPGGAERIIRMAETEGAHRRHMEEKALDAQIESMRRSYREARLGQVFAFSIATIFLIGGSYVAIHGQPWAGAIFGSVGLAGIVSAFIWGRTKKGESEKPTREPSKTQAAQKKKKGR